MRKNTKKFCIKCGRAFKGKKGDLLCDSCKIEEYMALLKKEKIKPYQNKPRNNTNNVWKKIKDKLV